MTHHVRRVSYMQKPISHIGRLGQHECIHSRTVGSFDQELVHPNLCHLGVYADSTFLSLWSKCREANPFSRQGWQSRRIKIMEMCSKVGATASTSESYHNAPLPSDVRALIRSSTDLTELRCLPLYHPSYLASPLLVFVFLWEGDDASNRFPFRWVYAVDLLPRCVDVSNCVPLV